MPRLSDNYSEYDEYMKYNNLKYKYNKLKKKIKMIGGEIGGEPEPLTKETIITNVKQNTETLKKDLNNGDEFDEKSKRIIEMFEDNLGDLEEQNTTLKKKIDKLETILTENFDYFGKKMAIIEQFFMEIYKKGLELNIQNNNELDKLIDELEKKLEKKFKTKIEEGVEKSKEGVEESKEDAEKSDVKESKEDTEKSDVKESDVGEPDVEKSKDGDVSFFNTFLKKK